METIHEFQREVTVEGFVSVGTIVSNANDTIPPSRINTLYLHSYYFENKTFRLEWNAVGDDLEYGRGKVKLPYS